jgi:RNA polymerase sigma factor (sigma-70 family)
LAQFVVRSNGFARSFGVTSAAVPSFVAGSSGSIGLFAWGTALRVWDVGIPLVPPTRRPASTAKDRPVPIATRRSRDARRSPSGLASIAPPLESAKLSPAPSARELVKDAAHPAMVRRVTVGRPDLEAEQALCVRAHAGDRAALGQILRAHGPSLYRAVLLPRLGSDAAAQDALGETYARVVERFHQFQWQSAGVYPWLRVVALRIALDALRARRREALYAPEDLEREIDASERDLSRNGEVELSDKRDMADARARVEAALAKVNPRYAEAIRLRVLEERPREDVAAKLDVTVATFDVVLHRALAALKKALDVAPAPPPARDPATGQPMPKEAKR